MSQKQPVAIQAPQTATSKQLSVTTHSFSPGGEIPPQFSSYGQSQAPEIQWSDVPAGTKSFVVLVEDPDAPGSAPFVHWLITGIPANAHQAPGEGTEGTNSAGQTGYYGPKPPPGPPHHYHFEVFALDALVSGQSRDAVLSAMSGHVLAKGEFVSTYQNQA